MKMGTASVLRHPEKHNAEEVIQALADAVSDASAKHRALVDATTENDQARQAVATLTEIAWEKLKSRDVTESGNAGHKKRLLDFLVGLVGKVAARDAIDERGV